MLKAERIVDAGRLASVFALVAVLNLAFGLERPGDDVAIIAGIAVALFAVLAVHQRWGLVTIWALLTLNWLRMLVPRSASDLEFGYGFYLAAPFGLWCTLGVPMAVATALGRTAREIPSSRILYAATTALVFVYLGYALFWNAHPTSDVQARVLTWTGWVVLGPLPLCVGLYFFVGQLKDAKVQREGDA